MCPLSLSVGGRKRGSGYTSHFSERFTFQSYQELHAEMHKSGFHIIGRSGLISLTFCLEASQLQSCKTNSQRGKTGRSIHRFTQAMHDHIFQVKTAGLWVYLLLFLSVYSIQYCISDKKPSEYIGECTHFLLGNLPINLVVRPPHQLLLHHRKLLLAREEKWRTILHFQSSFIDVYWCSSCITSCLYLRVKCIDFFNDNTPTTYH